MGEALFGDNLSGASSNRIALVKTPNEVLLAGPEGDVKQRWAAPGGDALFAFHADSTPALVFFPEGSSLARVMEDRLEVVPVDTGRLGGTIVSVAAPDHENAYLAVQRSEGTWLLKISTGNGDVLDERLLAGVAGRVHLLGDGGVLRGENGDLVWRAADGVERRFPLAAEVVSYAPLGTAWIAIAARHEGAGGLTRYGLRLEAGREGLYQLPEVAR
ncbi:MAG: hypothetical protein M1541_00790 [Acidobacteria bacterium]|nr:hypothetical protein [Acidobacteriota bacterium]